MKKLTALFVILVLLSSCNSSSEPPKKILKEANGRINSLLVVMKDIQWEGTLGDALREVVAEPVLGLPQPEAQFEVSQVSQDYFGRMFRATRNVISVEITDENSLKISKDVFASPQVILSITGTSEEEAVKIIKENKDKIVSAFKLSDISSVQKNILKSYYAVDKIKTFKEQNYSIKIPKKYNVVEDNGEFCWYRYRMGGDHTMELITYTYPLESPEDEAGENISINRNVIGSKYIPGQIEGSYMITEEAYTPHTFKVNLNGYEAYETRGKWEVYNMYMAGPFLSYSILDKANNRMIVVEGFTFAPAINKRDYMFELEAILRTFKMG